MSQIRIVTDSSAEIPASWIDRFGITVVPMEIRLGNKSWRDNIDLSPEILWSEITKNPGLATAVPPPLETWQRIYADLAQTTDQILSIHLSSKISPAVRLAQEAADSFLGRIRVVVLDSQLVSFGLGMLVQAAAEAAAAGRSLPEIVRLLRGMIPHIYVVFFVEALDYLERSTRIDRSQAVLGSLLGLKPMLIVEDGELMPLEKVITRKEAVEKLSNFISEFTRLEKLVVAHGADDHESQDLLERIIQTFPKQEVTICTYGPSLIAQIGPRAIGAVIYEGIF